jgi:Ca-activated chloride channel family protein
MMTTRQILLITLTAALCAACSAPTSDLAGAQGTGAEGQGGTPVASAEALDEALEQRPHTAGGPTHTAPRRELAAEAGPLPPGFAYAAHGKIRDHALDAPGPVAPRIDREGYPSFEDDGIRRPSEDPVSTFSIDVDTASYANVRRFLNAGALPRQDAVRTEELINYFDYGYAEPQDGAPFAVHTEIGPNPWHPGRHLLHIGLQGARKRHEDIPASNLVFLIDVSGSMQAPDKLDLLKASLKLLAARLRPVDHVAIVVYAGAAGVVLEPTAGDQRAAIHSALDRLSAGGSTNGGAGIQLAYALAEQRFIEGGVNRVILATDGDFNVGTVDVATLEDLVAAHRASGVALSVLGFGTGNYQDGLMQKLAQIGNGNAAYIDSMSEARKVLVEELAATLEVIAQDVKIQVEFNPALVSEYRLIGYETRRLAREDFNNDRVDAGDIGPGHTVTALYDIALVGEDGDLVDALRYGDADASVRDETRRRVPSGRAAELAHLRLRYKQPGSESSMLRSYPLLRSVMIDDLDATSDAYRFSAAAAAFGQLLRGGRYTNGFAFTDAARLARGARGEDPWGHRGEFLSLLATAQALAAPHLGQR